MSSRRRKIIRRFAVAGAASVLICGLLLGAFQVVFSRVPQYRVQLQDWVSERTGLAIEFSGLSARLRLYGPELVFRDAIVRSPDRTIVLATARRGSVAFDLWTSMRTGRLTAGRFSLTTPEIGLIRARDGTIQLVGQGALPDRDMSKPFPLDKLPVGEFWVTNAVVSFRDEATGRGPWALSGVSFRLDRQPGLMELRGNAALPAALGASLTFAATAQGALEESAAVVTTFNVEGKQLDLAGWADVLPDEWPAPETGHGSLLLRGALRGTQLTSVAAKVDFSNVAAVAPVWTIELPRAAALVVKAEDGEAKEPEAATAAAPDAAAAVALEQLAPPVAEMLSYSRVAFSIEANRVGDGWKLSASDVDVVRGAEPWRAAALRARWSKNDAGGMQLEAQADHVVLQSVWPLLAYLPESERLARVRALHARGSIDNLALNLQRAGADDPAQYSLQADIRSAGISPVARAPGFASLTGQVRATQAGGQLQLNTSDLIFDLPRMFRTPLAVRTLRAAVDWQREAAGWRLTSDDVRVETVDGNAVATFGLTLPDDADSSPVLQLKAQARDLNAAATPKYLPADKLSVKALQWLDRAFQSGRVPEGEVSYNGPMWSFPFRHGEGEFVARARVEGITFNYQDGWTPATDLTTQVEFRNQGMHVRAGTAALGDLRVADIRGDFADFKTGDIAVDAAASGDLDQALQFLQASPVSAALGEQFQLLRGQGATESHVSLRLPLKHIADRKVAVAAQLRDATVTMDGVTGPITHLSGTLNVRQSLPESADLQGQWLGGPLSVGIAAATANRSVLVAKGQASADKLTALLHLPAAVQIDGATNWQLRTQLAAGPDTKLVQKVSIDSTLNGLGLDLPHPVGKAQPDVRPLHVDLEYVGDDAMLARASFGDIRALLRLRRAATGWGLDRGGVRADAIAAALPDHRGIRIEGALDTLQLDDWFALRGRANGQMDGQTNGQTNAANAGTVKLSDFLHAASLRVGTLRIFGYEFQDVRGIMQAVDGGWKVDVTGPTAAGSLQIPDDFAGSQPLTASLEHLVVTSAPGAPSTTKKSPSDPRTWPALRAFVANLKVDNHTIGTVDLRTSHIANGLQIDTLTLVQEAAQGEASGQWLMTADGERATLQAKLSSTDVGATLRGLNYTQFMDAKHGEINADLAWPGGFDGDFLGKASGSLTVKADGGQLLNVKPGAGRVLGLMSVGALPRRLALDFSDLTEKGLSFDTVHGDFELRNGDAYTTNLLLRGPAAEIGIAGRTGLGAHDYDQTAVVTGNLGATLPVAGVLAGGPVVGAALLLFSRVFKEPLKGIVRGYYRISGSWDEPVVERVDAAEVREAAATATG